MDNWMLVANILSTMLGTAFWVWFLLWEVELRRKESEGG